MAEKILIIGESGTGKSTSIRNCDPAKTAIINPVGKPLPFRGSKRFTTLNGETDSDKICAFMKEQTRAGKKMIIVDDFQYILAVPYMDRIKENGWDKWNDFGENYFKIIDICRELPEDVCVYYMSHCETLENGLTTIKLIGKLLREKITIEGLFTIVLKTGVSEGKYYFFTQNSGKDTVKSPMGMFDAFSIDNDLAYVDAKIRNYYEFDGAQTDDEIAKLDETKAGDIEKPQSRRSRRAAANEKAAETSDDTPETTEADDMPKPRKSRNTIAREKAEETFQEQQTALAEDPRDEVPFDEAPYAKDDQDDIDKAINEAGDAPATEEPKRRTRRARA